MISIDMQLLVNFYGSLSIGIAVIRVLNDATVRVIKLSELLNLSGRHSQRFREDVLAHAFAAWRGRQRARISEYAFALDGEQS